MKALKIAGIILGIFLVGYLIDWIASREERAIMAPVLAAADALEITKWTELEKALDAGFTYGSLLPWVGDGDRDGARSKLQSFWPQVRMFTVILRESKVEPGENDAKATISGNLKILTKSSGFAIYKFRADLELRKMGGDWKISRAYMAQLEPGLF